MQYHALPRERQQLGTTPMHPNNISAFANQRNRSPSTRRSLTRLGQWVVSALLSIGLLGLGACSSTASRHNDALARSYGYHSEPRHSGRFLHQLYFYRITPISKELHVYIEGDGVAWLNRHTIAPDPTSHDPLMLQLMHQDNKASLYLGRPCYGLTVRDPKCSPHYWTFGRYAPEIIDSMASVLTTVIEQHRVERLRFFGHSGGGTLAVLLARRFPQTRSVVTIAANLDTDAWAQHHHFSPLSRSLNPAREPPVPADILQWHLAGGRDRNIPPDMLRNAVDKTPTSLVCTLQTFGHHCCWEKIWTQVLQEIQVDQPSCDRLEHALTDQ